MNVHLCVLYCAAVRAPVDQLRPTAVDRIIALRYDISKDDVPTPEDYLAPLVRDDAVAWWCCIHPQTHKHTLSPSLFLRFLRIVFSKTD